MRKRRSSPVSGFFQLTLGTILVVLGVYFFKFPNHFSFGGVTGLAVVAEPYLPISASDFTFLVNMLLLVVGFAFLGRQFGLKTVYTSLLMSVLLSLLERICPLSAPLTDQPVLELGFAIALPAVGAALLFQQEASGGGTDIIAMVLKKYTNIHIGQALFYSDLLFVVCSALVFGVQTLLFSFAGLMIKSLVIDNVIASLNTSKCLSIICTRPEPICQFITDTLGRGATVVAAEGAFTHEKRSILYTALSPAEALRLRRFLREQDPSAFVMVTTSSEILGRGFQNA